MGSFLPLFFLSGSFAAAHPHHVEELPSLQGLGAAICGSLLGAAACSLVAFMSGYVLLLKRQWVDRNLGLLLALGASTLLGDVIFHVLPHALAPHSHHHDAEDTHRALHSLDTEELHSKVFKVSSALIGGLALAHVLDILGHALRAWTSPTKVMPSGSESEMTRIVNPSNGNGTPIAIRCRLGSRDGESLDTQKSIDAARDPPDSEKVECASPSSLLRALLQARPAVATNLLCDLLHNFLDGVSLAAAFSVSKGVGISTTFAVIAHEVAQEISDCVLLRHGGLSFGQTIAFNVAVSLSALVGAIASWVWILSGSSQTEGVGEAHKATLLCVSGGTMTYLALADMLPESLNALYLSLEDTAALSVLQRVCGIVKYIALHLAAFSVGIAVPVAMAVYME